MPWLRARLRGQLVYARADEGGALREEDGVVEVRYRPNDGRRYSARAANLAVADPTLLPDSACTDARAVERDDTAARAAPAAAPAGRATGGRPGKVDKAAAASSHAGQVVPAGAIVAYTDGACSGNPGPAGLGVVLVDGERRAELSEYLGQGTNNIAELTAVLRAVERAPDGRPLLVHTDSQYSIGVLAKGWKAKANTELILRIRAVLAARPGVRLVYVPGHAGVPLNERADQLARLAVESRRTQQSGTLTPPDALTPPAV
ncbi:MAG: ribonuclease HI [Myxococcales bacterium]|nr:MAG: ribonuclease HI [Myxococcales bacterium]